MEMRWIPCNERMPEEQDSIFAKLYGTDRWRNSMFRKRSHRVLATIKFKDGSIMTDTACTFDGEWSVGPGHTSRDGTVIAWMPFPAPYEEQEEKTEGTDWTTRRFMRVE